MTLQRQPNIFRPKHSRTRLTQNLILPCPTNAEQRILQQLPASLSTVHLCSCDAKYPLGISAEFAHAVTHLMLQPDRKPNSCSFLFFPPASFGCREHLINAIVLDNSLDQGKSCLNKCITTTANKRQR